jgi:hypothetical protein
MAYQLDLFPVGGGTKSGDAISLRFGDFSSARLCPRIRSAGIDVVLLLSWIFLITESWVKRAAVLYVDRLLEALDVLV